MTARELAEMLGTPTAEAAATWLGRLPELGLVASSGRTKGTRYFVPPTLLKNSGINLPTSLRRIEPHRMEELVREDLRRYPRSRIGEISARIGPEVARTRLKRTLANLVQSGIAVMDGVKNGARYRLANSV
jgi:ATP-dependent DNA helicase RecG